MTRSTDPKALPRAPTRRETLALALSAGLGALLPAPVMAQAQTGDALASLGALLDTFLPADALAPAATALGVDQEMRAFLAKNQQLERLFVAALGWIDGQEAEPFHARPPDRREALLAALSVADGNQIPGRFYHIARALAVEFYYARPEALAGLPLQAAPQPLGYPPPWI